MNYLLDTCVISEPTKPAPNPHVLDWLAGQDEDAFFLSVLTLGELEIGVSRLPASRRRDKIRKWIDLELRRRFEGRIVDIDAAVALRWGTLVAASALAGRPLPVVDGLLVATAFVHDLVIVSRNVDDLSAGGARVINPWD